MMKPTLRAVGWVSFTFIFFFLFFYICVIIDWLFEGIKMPAGLYGQRAGYLFDNRLIRYVCVLGGTSRKTTVSFETVVFCCAEKKI